MNVKRIADHYLEGGLYIDEDESRLQELIEVLQQQVNQLRAAKKRDA